MDMLMEILFSPAHPFIWHPERAYLMAGGFAILFTISVFRTGGFKLRVHSMILAALILWILFGLNEYQAEAKGWNIRVDLFFIWPLLLLVSIVATWRGARSVVSRKTKYRK